MHPTLRAASRWAAWGTGAAAALGLTFTLGVLAGAGSTPDDPAQARQALLDEAADQIAADGLHPVDRDVLDAAAIKAMLAAADDQWGSWDDSQAGGAYAGIGLWLRRTESALVVSQVATLGPADVAGIRVGDEVRAVDGRSTKTLTASDAAFVLRGRVGTPIVLAVARGTTTRSLTLTRAVVPAPGVTSAMVAPNVGRIVVPAFTRGVGRQVREAAATLRAQKVTGLVLDLRGNPGGLLTEAVETASVFLDGGEVVTYTRRDEQAQRLDAGSRGDTRTPLVVLVDGGTASAAEVVAGALQDRGRAVVVGGRTFGKGTVQEPHRLPDGSSLALTVARYALPSGRSVEGVGIEPDIQVGGDVAAMQRAIEVLIGLRADTGSGRG